MMCNSETVMITNMDFPKHYTNGMHPDDGRIVDKPIDAEFMTNDPIKRNLRLILIISFQLKVGYLSMSFIVDTGAIGYIFVTPKVLNIMKAANLILESGDSSKFIRLHFGEGNKKQCEFKFKILLNIFCLRISSV